MTNTFSFFLFFFFQKLLFVGLKCNLREFRCQSENQNSIHHGRGGGGEVQTKNLNFRPTNLLIHSDQYALLKSGKPTLFTASDVGSAPENPH